MKCARLCVAILALASACTRSGPPDEPSSEPPPVTGTPSVEPDGPRLADGTPLPAGCLGGAGPSHTVSFIADGRAWALDPSDGDLACLFPVDDPGPFVWGPQGDRVMLADFEIRGLGAEAPDLPPVDERPGPFDWGHPLGLAVVFADDRGDPWKRFMDDGRLAPLTSLPSGEYLEVAYHPSGLALAFVVEGEDGQEIWLSTNEGEDPERLIFSEEGTIFPSIAFTPDGDELWWTALHAGVPQLHSMDLADRSGFATSWRGDDETQAGDLRMAPAGQLKSVDLGGRCQDRRALVVAGRSAVPALPGETRPTTALGWLDRTTLLVAAGGCGEPQDLYAVDGLGEQDPVALVFGVELGAPRTAVHNPPREVPAPMPEEEPPPGGVG